MIKVFILMHYCVSLAKYWYFLDVLKIKAVWVLNNIVLRWPMQLIWIANHNNISSALQYKWQCHYANIK